ncbi:hypothetical protein YC2023_016128 [Brassica napus]
MICGSISSTSRSNLEIPDVAPCSNLTNAYSLISQDEFHGLHGLNALFPSSPKTTDCSLGPLDAWICIEGAIFLVAIGLFFGLFEGVALNRNLSRGSGRIEFTPTEEDAHVIADCLNDLCSLFSQLSLIVTMNLQYFLREVSFFSGPALLGAYPRFWFLRELVLLDKHSSYDPSTTWYCRSQSMINFCNQNEYWHKRMMSHKI